MSEDGYEETCEDELRAFVPDALETQRQRGHANTNDLHHTENMTITGVPTQMHESFGSHQITFHSYKNWTTKPAYVLLHVAVCSKTLKK